MHLYLLSINRRLEARKHRNPIKLTQTDLERYQTLTERIFKKTFLYMLNTICNNIDDEKYIDELCNLSLHDIYTKYQMILQLQILSEFEHIKCDFHKKYLYCEFLRKIYIQIFYPLYASLKYPPRDVKHTKILEKSNLFKVIDLTDVSSVIWSETVEDFEELSVVMLSERLLQELQDCLEEFKTEQHLK